MCRQIVISLLLISLTHTVLAASKISEVCRDAYPSNRAVPQVAHGIATRAAEFPYMVALGWGTSSSGSYDYRCGGALISKQHVLTAAHCVSPDKPIVVLLGGVELVSTNKPYDIGDIVIHPNYKSEAIYDDIAVIKLKSSVSFSDTIKPICIWSDSNVADNMPITVIGYGITESGKESPNLLKGNMIPVTNAECNEIFKKMHKVKKEGILKSQICAKDPDNLHGTCKGDSGGPLVTQRLEEGVTRPYVLGIYTQGIGCSSKFPGIYIRVSSYLGWFEKIVST